MVVLHFKELFLRKYSGEINPLLKKYLEIKEISH
jgi:hypothetical protein